VLDVNASYSMSMAHASMSVTDRICWGGSTIQQCS